VRILFLFSLFHFLFPPSPYLAIFARAPLSRQKPNSVNLPENARVTGKNSVNLPEKALHFASKHAFHPIKSSQPSMVLKPPSTRIIQHSEFRVHACANMNFQSKLKINPHFSTENRKIANPSPSP
jgi:hypothetical protein